MSDSFQLGGRILDFDTGQAGGTFEDPAPASIADALQTLRTENASRQGVLVRLDRSRDTRRMTVLVERHTAGKFMLEMAYHEDYEALSFRSMDKLFDALESFAARAAVEW